MYRGKKYLVIAIIESMALLNISLVALASNEININVYRIMASSCKWTERHNAIIQTGFLTKINGNSGIITALHGVVGCDNIMAENNGTQFADLEIKLVDYSRDVVFLLSSNISSLPYSSSSIEMGRLPTTLNEKIKVVGYPHSLLEQLSFPLSPHELPLRKLESFLPFDALSYLEKRNSPNVEIEVFGVIGALQQGLSGAPILDENGNVIAVANGGLTNAKDISWAIPFEEISWSEVNRYTEELSDLIKKNRRMLFSTLKKTLDIPEGIEEERREIEALLKDSTQNCLHNTICK